MNLSFARQLQMDTEEPGLLLYLCILSSTLTLRTTVVLDTTKHLAVALQTVAS